MLIIGEFHVKMFKILYSLEKNSSTERARFVYLSYFLIIPWQSTQFDGNM